MEKSLNTGDHFRRKGYVCMAKTYSVVAVFEPNGQQLHARLVSDLVPNEMVTISVSTLNDRRFWERLNG